MGSLTRNYSDRAYPAWPANTQAYRPYLWGHARVRCVSSPLSSRGAVRTIFCELLCVPLPLKSRLGITMNHGGQIALMRKDENVMRELKTALSAAKEAGEVLRKGFGWQHSVRYKGEVDLVTEVDEQAEQVIRENLLGTFPTYGMLAEEGGELRERRTPAGSWTPWTAPQLRPRAAHLLRLHSAQRAGEVILGVVHDPIREETYVAERGGGATLNGEPIKVSDTDELIQALIATGFPLRPRRDA